ncbi:MAG TPA: hypothetical protein VLA56_19930 [Pseudomonadales bacterium]|nr:hypothetical protein [Pseudomonadales bacterium]
MNSVSRRTAPRAPVSGRRVLLACLLAFALGAPASQAAAAPPRLLPGTPLHVFATAGRIGVASTPQGIRSSTGALPGLAGRAPLHALPPAGSAARPPLAVMPAGIRDVADLPVHVDCRADRGRPASAARRAERSGACAGGRRVERRGRDRRVD